MHGITSLDGHGKASGDMNKAMERMSIVFKGRLSREQLNQIKSDIQTTAMSGMAGEMLSAAGEGGDTMMAHMSPETIGMAQEMGILPQGQMNPMTGLPAFQGDNPGNEPDDDNGDTGTGTGSSAGAESSAGTPLCQYILVKKDKVDSVVRGYEKKDIDNLRLRAHLLDSKFVPNYNDLKKVRWN